MIEWESKNKQRSTQKRWENVEPLGLYTHTHTHTIQFSKEIEEVLVSKEKQQIYKINIEANRGEKAFICDKKKDRKQTDCIKQENVKVFEINSVAK